MAEPAPRGPGTLPGRGPLGAAATAAGVQQGQGFTLLELAIALAVSVILLAMALPSLGERMARERLAAVAHELSADLMLARHEAARLRQPVHLSFRGGADWCWALSLDASADCQAATPGGPGPLLKAVRAKDHPGIQLLDAQPFALDPRETQPRPPGTDPGRADFGDRYREQLRVQLTPMGRPGICVVSGHLPGIAACGPHAGG